jgi:phage shock protein A
MEQINKIFEQQKNEIEEYKKINNQLLEKIQILEEKIKKYEDNENKIKNTYNSNRSIENISLDKNNSISKISNSSDQEVKIEKITKRYKEYKELFKASEKQCNTLKQQIKELKQENELLKNNDNKINDYEELNKLFNIAFENYKPKKKEQIDALNKIKEYFGNEISGGAINLSSQSDLKKKKGLFGIFNK